MRLSRMLVGTFTAAAAWGLTLTPAFAAANTVTVQPGDSLWKIAHARGISLQSLESANPSANPADLLVGTVLKLPTTNAAQSSSVSTTAQQNLYWMEHIINAEAGGESQEAQVAVGNVIMHRLANGSYGKTVHDVVFQIADGHYQFSCVPNGYIYQTPNASSITAAEKVLQTQDDEVPGALVFYNPSQTPASSWVRTQPTITQIDDLVFAK
ncbi:cell wall hydrolase [Alicyclobacillus fastidiosus]|uniref:Cell wall hydrolase n=1 Tax=Alicyclobacillus fastidiosus TaxID=392011 RepID=A0ABV5A9J3_9BACL|nr:cell wall hydrolase [Alicyclobacillus fastidiosus]WEH10864.1 cell wall hydrolase [Alicyclobacillus fastidiosus]